MESHQNLTPVDSHHVDTSRPSLGFPLGTALLLIIIFSLSGFFSCCYHWDKIRSLRRRRSYNSDDTDLEADHQHIQSPTKAKPMLPDSKVNQNESMPVLMPGDQIPKFIALPCPCEPPRPRLEKITVEVQPPPSVPPRPSPSVPPRPSPPPTFVYNHVAQFPVYYDG